MKAIYYLTQGIIKFSMKRMTMAIYNTGNSNKPCKVNKVGIRTTNS